MDKYTHPFSREVMRMLLRAGFLPNFTGFAFLGAAVQITIDDGLGRRKIVGDLYPTVAKMFGVTPYSVEKNIRTAIATAWSGGALRNFYAGVGMYALRKPTNSACITNLAYIQLSGMAEQTAARRG